MSTEPTFSARVADEVRAMTYKRRLNKSELARRLGVSHTWVTNRLAGHQQIGLDELERIAAALEVDITELLPAPARADRTGSHLKDHLPQATAFAADRPHHATTQPPRHRPNARSATTAQHRTTRRAVRLATCPTDGPS